MTEFISLLLQTPSIIKVGLIFCSILVVYRLGLSLGKSVVLHAAVLTIWTGSGWAGLKFQFLNMVAARNSLLLVVILLLLFFTEALRSSGRMDRTVAALREWLQSSRILISGLPALVGLLPMPGGALFSAPLVASIDQENKLTAPHKAAINYWFRHVWEYWWPLYPGVVLAIRYSDLPIGTFFLIQIPLTIASIAGGYLFILRKIKKDKHEGMQSRCDLHAVRSTIGPIGVLVAISVCGSLLLPHAGVDDSKANLLSMIAGLIVSLTIIFRSAPQSLKPSMRMFSSKSTWEMMLVVVGVQAFSGALQIPLGTANNTLVSSMHDSFLEIGVPVLAVMFLVPFISGAVTGIAVGFVGASFPLVFALIGQNPPVNVLIATTAFAYASGYLGMILSPVHICFVVSNQYFRTPLFHSYRYLWGPSAVVFVASLLIAGSYYLFL